MEGENEDRICSLVHSIEEEMHKAGVNVNFSQLKSHLLQIREDHSNSNMGSDVVVNGDIIEVECNSPRHAQISSDPSASGSKEQAKVSHNSVPDPNPNPGKPKNWSSLFKAQAPSKVMKLEHFPEMQRGNEAVVELDESDVDTNSWNHCLIGPRWENAIQTPECYSKGSVEGVCT